MSRTEKDRPYWVKRNDKSIPRVEHHNHHEAGQPIHRYLPVTDENGNPVMETYETYGLTGYSMYNIWEHRFKEYDTFEELQADNPGEVRCSKEFYQRWGMKEKTRVKRERTVVGYRPAECTIDEWVPRGNYYSYAHGNAETHLCHHELAKWNGGSWYDNRPQTDERKAYHRSARSNENIALRQLAKDANNGYYDEDGYEDVFELRTQNHRGWWD